MTQGIEDNYLAVDSSGHHRPK